MNQSAFSQSLELVSENYSSIDDLTSFNGLLFFSAHQGDYNDQLYRSDGTEEGTFMLKEVTSNSWSWTGSMPNNMIVANNKMFFVQKDSTNLGRKLWVTDGTSEGTFIIKNTPIYDKIVFNDQLYFVSNSIDYGFELWKSDGSEQGTIMVKDINNGSNGSNPSNFMILNNELFFFAADCEHGREFWRTNGTDSGTVMIKDINVGIGNSDTDVISSYIEWEDNLYFSANDGIHGAELWVTDGTSDGTKMLKDINIGSDNSRPGYYCLFEDYIYFSAADTSYLYENVHPPEIRYNTELYRTDGTFEGTCMITDINENGIIGSGVSRLMVCNNHLLFTATDGDSGMELWKTEGIDEEIYLLKDIYPGDHGSYLSEFTKTSNEVYFRAMDYDHGHELWRTAGDSSNTDMVHDIESGYLSSFPQSLTVVDSVLYFVTNNREKLMKLNGILGTINNIEDNYLEDSTIKVDIYPMPFNNKIFVKTESYKDKNVLVHLYSADSQLVFHKEYYNTETIILNNLNNLKPGLYLLEIVIENRKTVLKCIKSN